MPRENYKSAYIYLKEDYYRKPKELFGFLLSIIESVKKNRQALSLLDIGCARGEFLYHAKLRGMFSRLAGVDYSQVLIKQARLFEGLSGAEFHCDRADRFSLKEKFDAITLTGLLSFYDGIKIPLANLKRHLKPDGVALITGIFNPLPVDVIVRYRNKKKGNQWEEGWNNLSMDTVSEVLNKVGLKLKRVHKFNLSFDLPAQDDPMRGWTVRLNGEKKFMIGIGFVYDMLTLEVGFKYRPPHK